MRKVLPDWDWSNLKMHHLYAYWHSGDPAIQLLLIKLLKKKDFSRKLNTREGRTYCELKQLMIDIDNTAKAKGVVPKK